MNHRLLHKNLLRHKATFKLLVSKYFLFQIPKIAKYLSRGNIKKTLKRANKYLLKLQKTVFLTVDL